MSADQTTTEYHLTPHGWVRGTFSSYGHATEKVERPSDAVETWEREMEQSSVFAPEDIKWRIAWTDPDATDEERQKLHAKFPRPQEQGTVFTQYRKPRRRLAYYY